MKNSSSPRALVWTFVLSAALALVCPLPAAQPVAAAPAKKVDEKDAPPYRIAHGDVLAVSFLGETDLNSGNNKVEPRGTITLQLINEIRLAGMTVLEAKAAIETAYREQRYLRNPVVKVTIEQYVRRSVHVSGKVNIQGTKDLPPDRQTTIKDIILLCQGFQETANGRNVRVTRTMPDGSLKTITLDVQSALLGKDNATASDANFVVEPEDTIYVPEKMI